MIVYVGLRLLGLNLEVSLKIQSLCKKGVLKWDDICFVSLDTKL